MLRILIPFLLIACHSRLKQEVFPQSEIRCISIEQKFPQIDMGGKNIGYSLDDAKMYFYKDQVLLEASYTFASHETDGSIIKRSKEYSTFVYTSGSVYGYLYDTARSIFEKRVRVDSFLRANWVTGANLYPVFTDNSITNACLHTDFLSGNSEMEYSFSGMQEGTEVTGKIFLGFTKEMQGLNYSMCKELDTLKDRKLYKIRVINDRMYFKSRHLTVDSFEQSRVMHEIPVPDPGSIRRYFERYTLLKEE